MAPVIPSALKYIVIGVLYVLMPIDLIPDFLPPLLGRLDDALVIGYLIWRYRRLHKTAVHYYQKAENLFSGKSEKASSKEEDPVIDDSTSSPQTPHQILGVLPSAKEKEIEQAYRKLVTKYHPDKVEHLGEEFQKLAHEKMLEIQKAYEALQR
jgi:DnaJ like chaperone protein